MPKPAEIIPTAENVKRPLVFQLVNKVGKIFPESPELSVDSILNTAKKKTNLTDWGSASFQQGLEMLLQACKREARMTYISRLILQKSCVNIVRDRLLLEDAIKRNPEITAVKIRKPIFVLGLPRSGTTYLQNLLARDEQLRPLYYWEQQSLGQPPSSENLFNNPQLRQARKDIARMRWAAKEFFSAHEIQADRTEEDNGLMGREFVNILHFMFRDIPSYVDWLLSKDMTEMYGYHKRQLQFLGYHFQDRRWILKAPAHLAFLDALLKVYPDAQILQTHRDPLEIVPSMCSLAVISRQIFSDEVHPLQTAQQWLDLISQIMQRSLDLEPDLNRGNIFHISYPALVADPMQTITEIYKWLELELSENTRNNISKWVKSSQNYKSSNPHIYSLEQFALQESDIREKFEQYYESYRDYIYN